ncbi:ATP-binding protein [Fusobacterium simiae]|uniref:ATP-binding protein n=1 Tax=Fusobacterium TaxID=848 RepID=UPI0003FA0CAC|nr:MULTISPECIES: ATP-binding protein [Fusobacterium]MDC7954297.1 ATP-binding protein [Fusobacterium simiae]
MTIRDRGDKIHIYPLSFAEVYNTYEDKNLAWCDYVVFGGMPYILSLESFEEKSIYLKNLFEETYIRDIVERNKIQNNSDILDILLNFISSAVGSLTNPLKLSNRFLSENKIIYHITLFLNIFLILKNLIYYIVLKDMI